MPELTKQTGIGTLKHNLIFVIVLAALIPLNAHAEKWGKVENGIITDVIIADDSFANAINGDWIKLSSNHNDSNFGGIGYHYNYTSQKLYPDIPPPNILETITNSTSSFIDMIVDFFTPENSTGGP